jgi:RNA polymerase sigma factor (sigma-70 family)
MHDEADSRENNWLAGCFGSSGYQIHQVIPDDLDVLTTESAETTAERQQDSAFVRSAMQHLTDRQADVIELRYGIKNGRDYTQTEVASMLGISRQTVDEAEKSALRKMRKILTAVF